MLKPLNENVVLELVEVEVTTASGIIMTGEAAKPKHSEGVIVAVGNGRLLQSGDIKPLSVEVGQRVIYDGFNGTKVTHQGKELIIISESNILAIIN